MTTVPITQCLESDSLTQIGPHDPLPILLYADYSERPASSGPGRRRDGMAGRLRPNRAGSASHRLDVYQDLALSGRLMAEGQAACDHLLHGLIHRVEETKRSFWHDSWGHADDQADVHVGGYARGYQEFFAR